MKPENEPFRKENHLPGCWSFESSTLSNPTFWSKSCSSNGTTKKAQLKRNKPASHRLNSWVCMVPPGGGSLATTTLLTAFGDWLPSPKGLGLILWGSIKITHCHQLWFCGYRISIGYRHTRQKIVSNLVSSHTIYISYHIISFQWKWKEAAPFKGRRSI